MDSKVELTTISSFNETVSAELGIDFQNIEIERNPYDLLEIPICIGTDRKYHGKIFFNLSNLTIREHTKLTSFGLYIDNANILEGEASLTIDQKHLKQFDKVPNLRYDAQKDDIFHFQSKSGGYCIQFKISPMNLFEQYGCCLFSIKGRIKIVFKPTYESLTRMKVIQNLQKNFTSSIMKTLEEVQDHPTFTLMVENQAFKFNKNCFSAVSSVFADMFSNCIEGTSVPVTDGTSIQTMNTFKKLMQNQEINENEITTDLYLFGDKYNIQPFVFNRENISEITHAAYMMKNDSLLELSAKFLENNKMLLITDEKMKHLVEYDSEFCAKLFRKWITS